VGGLLFGMELMSSHWSQHLLLSCFFTTAVVSVTARVLMRMCSSGGCGFFGEGNFIIFHISDAQARHDAAALRAHRRSAARACACV